MPRLPVIPTLAPRARRALLAALAPALTLGAADARCAGEPDARRDARAVLDAPRGGRLVRGSSDGALLAPTTRAAPQDSARIAAAAAAVREARTLETRALGGATRAAPARLDAAAAREARAAYERAAALLPAVGDWLRLRALALEPDAAARARVRAALTAPAAHERAAHAEADALARSGDVAGAAAAWATLGAEATALALRLHVADASPDSAARTAGRAEVRAALVALLPRADRAASTRREAATLLDSAFAPLPPAERLLVARTLAAAGGSATLGRAASAYADALAAGAGGPADRQAHGAVLARAGRWREAAAQLARARAALAADAAPASRGLAAAAAYQEGRALLRSGDGAAATERLRRAVADFPGDTATASARYLLADLAVDGGREADARAGFLDVARLHGESPWAPTAALRAAMIALRARDAAAAASELDALVARWPDADERLAAGYWAGRAWADAGDAARAAERWEAVIAREPASYYAGLAARRLQRAPWVPPEGAPIALDPADAEVARAAGDRAALLERIGLGPEAGWERDWLTRWADSSTARLLGAAAALRDAGRPGPSIRLAARAVERGAARTAPVYRLLFPLPYADAVRREATAQGIEPALAAALIKQESNFTADAVSPVGARGLMQLMPDVGRSLWRASDAAARGPWSAARLFDPDVNLALGMRHLRAALRQWPDAERALAAYNAGGSRVRRWRTAPGTDDPELFVERIPYEETRDYVRIVLRARDLYRALYPEALAAR